MDRPKCGTPEYARMMYEKHGEKRRAYQRQVIGRKKLRNKQYITNILADASCETCGDSRPMVLTFDHLDRTEKFKCVGTLVNQGYSLRKIKEEIAKCRILCCNCHAIHTRQQIGSYHDYLAPISEQEFDELYGDLT